ncbi:PREDICTED: casein kinase I-like [Rhagoletis zephyria]|uniref:casein kinase I-like n=1 Tax=Rhagoletis zephyria TaxID=28612 RepID=UPI0008114A34|nr:PREDICTED: casein kinase I-like [Rhagoletis zephyria]
MRFASANNQQGREISRRDDLEALLYQAVYFVKKELPWDGHGQEITNVFQKQIAQGQFKEKLAPEELCIDMPRQFAEYLRLVRKCEFSQRPPYRKLLGLMRDVLTYLGIYADEDFYDWDESQIPLPLYRRS